MHRRNLLKIHAATDCAVCQELLLSANFEISPALESKLYEYVMQLEQARMATFHAQTCFMQPTQLLRLPPKIGLTLLSALDALQLCGTSERKHGSHATSDDALRIGSIVELQAVCRKLFEAHAPCNNSLQAGSN